MLVAVALVRIELPSGQVSAVALEQVAPAGYGCIAHTSSNGEMQVSKQAQCMFALKH